MHFGADQSDQWETTEMEDLEVKCSRKARREELVEAEKEWWNSNWTIIQKSFLIASVGIGVPLPCPCGHSVKEDILVVSLEGKLHSL
jgi:hypothetical protein